MDTPKTLLEAARYFADVDVCEAYMREIRWAGGEPVCPACGVTGDRIGAIATRRMLRCKDCRKQFSHKVGTIFEDSPLGLDKWFVAVWAIANCKNGISSHELGRAIGVTQKTAWFMLHRIRKAMEIDGDGAGFDGPTEADTTYVGGAAANMHKARREKAIKGRGAVGKVAVHGVLQRTTAIAPSQVRAHALGREDAETLLGEVRQRVGAAFAGVANKLDDCRQSLHTATIELGRAASIEVVIPVRPAITTTTANITKQASAEKPAFRAHKHVVIPDASDKALSSGAKSLLQVAAKRHPMLLTQSQLGTLAGYTPSTVRTYIPSLIGGGYLRKKGSSYELTQLGIDTAGVKSEAGGSVEDVRAMWLSKLSQGEAKILKAIIDAGDRELDMDELSHATGLTRSSLRTYLPALRRNQLVERGSLRASEEIRG